MTSPIASRIAAFWIRHFPGRRSCKCFSGGTIDGRIDAAGVPFSATKISREDADEPAPTWGARLASRRASESGRACAAITTEIFKSLCACLKSASLRRTLAESPNPYLSRSIEARRCPSDGFVMTRRFRPAIRGEDARTPGIGRLN